MSALDEIKSEIKSISEGISGVGKIYDRIVYAKDQAQLKEMFTKDGVLNTLMFRQVKRVTDSSFEHYDEVMVERTWEFSLLYAYNKENNSEQLFDELCENLCEVFNSNENLNGKVNERVGFMDMVEKEDISYHNVLCHSAKFIMVTKD
jgi:hypothetical protein